jgi:tRNA A-37 threonylcarbamoyl transferase component Bud32
MSDPIVPARPDLAGDLDTARAYARVIAGLFGDGGPDTRIGRYVVRGKLGQGAMGVVYEAFDNALDRRVAIKLVRTDVDTAVVGARLVREGQALARLNHPNVVHVYEFGQDHGRVFVAMELVDGTTLREWLRARRRGWSDVLDACIAAGRGLAAVHAQGLTHRDFKPDNVMVGDDGRVRVMDFGLARFVVDEPLPSASPSAGQDRWAETTAVGRVVGTPAYMAPEQRRLRAANASSDQFSFCVTLWEALLGRRPFTETGEPMAPSSSGPRIPAWLRAVLLRGLHDEPGSRWPDIGALLDALERGRARARRRRRAVVVAGVLGLLGVLAIAHVLDRRRRERECEQEGNAIAENGEAHGLADTARVWADARNEACRRARVDDIWDDDDYARASWCLDRQRMRIEAGVDEITAADACLDAQSLARISVPPPDQRDEAYAIADALTIARAAATHDIDALARLTARADALDFAALRAETRTVRAEALVRSEDLATAESLAWEAYFLAANDDAWAQARDAAALLGDIVGRTPARRGEADAWDRHAAAADDLSQSPLRDESDRRPR